MIYKLILTVICFLAGAAAFAAEKLNPDTPRDAVKLYRKILCGSLDDGRTNHAFAEGRVFSRLTWEKHRHVFNVWIMNSRQCDTRTDKERGKGFRMVSREVMLFLDPETNEILDTWENPWTGEVVEVDQVQNDPVNMREPTFEIDKDGKPLSITFKDLGYVTSLPAEVPLFYTNPLGGDYQEYVGGQYQGIEVFDYFFLTDELFDVERSALPSARVNWVRVSQWLPFMKMGSRPGGMLFNAVGGTIESLDELPPAFLAELKKNYPKYLTPPATDDQRPNETSWITIKNLIDQKRAEAEKE